ncbi:MAG: hypothetical protein QOK38_4233 [Acidobacteriaceae bacterium]|nr:hypothetical protein [Acidobacteriaceae bacterium]
MHRLARVPLLARERIAEDHQAIDGLTGLNLHMAAEGIHPQRCKLRICLKNLIEIGAARSQAAARLSVGQGDDRPVVLKRDGCAVGIVQTDVRENQQLVDDLVLALHAGSAGVAASDLRLHRIDGDARNITGRYRCLASEANPGDYYERRDDDGQKDAHGQAAIIGWLVDLREVEAAGRIVKLISHGVPAFYKERVRGDAETVGAFVKIR